MFLHNHPAGVASRPVEKIHTSESDSPEQANHVLQNPDPRIGHCQPSSRWRGKRRNEYHVVFWFTLMTEPIAEFEVFQVLEQLDEAYYLTIGTFGFRQGERVDRWELEVIKAPSNPWHEAGDVQVVQPKFLDAG